MVSAKQQLELEKEIESLGNAIEADSENSELYYKKSLVLDRSLEIEDALECNTIALNLNPDNKDILIQQASLFSSIGEYEQALDIYHKLEELHPDNLTLTNQAQCFEALNMNNEAILCYNKAIQLSSTSFFAYTDRAILLERMGYVDKSLKEYEYMISEFPLMPISYIARILLLTKQDEYKKVLQYSNEFLNLFTSKYMFRHFTGVYNQKSYALYKLGRYEEAISNSEQASELGYNHISTMTYKAWSQTKLKKYENARLTYDEIIKKYPQQKILYINKARILITELSENFTPQKYKNTITEINKVAKQVQDNFPYGTNDGHSALQTLSNYVTDLKNLMKRKNVINLNKQKEIFNLKTNTVYIVNNMQQLMSIINKTPKDTAFRGQNCLNWELKPTIYRNENEDKLKEYTYNFQRHCKSLSDYDYDNKYKDIDWLSLMQHSGLETPLLDWSDNILNALFFAVDNEHNITGLPTINIARYGQIYSRQQFINESIHNRIVFLAPELIHTRAKQQNSLFSYHPKFKQTLETDQTITIVINPDLIDDIIKFLNDSGVNSFKIYHDLENLAKWIKAKDSKQLPVVEVMERPPMGARERYKKSKK